MSPSTSGSFLQDLARANFPQAAFPPSSVPRDSLPNSASGSHAEGPADASRTTSQAAHAPGDAGARHNTQNVGELAAGVAHDLNNFLQVIGASLELLARRAGDDPASERFHLAAQGALLRAMKLSRQLLTLSRGHELQLEVLRLDDLQSTMGDILRRALPDSVALTMHHAADLWPCTTDACLLEAAILNLAINARDAMPEGGTLRIGVDNRCVDADDASAEQVRAGDFVVASVCDNGTGMDPAVRARAFEPFFTTKEFGKGTGLGLSQVQAFAKRCNGYATIISMPSQGTEVRIYMPRAE